MRNSILLVCAGEINLAQLQKYAKLATYIIAVDHGYDYLDYINIKPNIIIGDLDSKKFNNDTNIEIIKFDPVKDNTDTELALRYALTLNPTSIYILGATGRRLDHFFANLNLLYTTLDKVPTYILDKNNKIYLISSFCKIEKEYKYFSVLPFTDRVKKLTIGNAKYPVSKIDLDKSTTLTISNEAYDDCFVRIGEGVLIIIESDDEDVY